MSATPTTPAPGAKTNHIGLTVLDYRGNKTTLCAGCGHNAISERIIDAAFEMGVQPENLVKLSGIGCSSKSPAYFVRRSHGFNAVHGRMPSVATGVALANHKVMLLGVSGDGDTASIGIGQFMHLMRRNLPIIYIIEDNGVYGLTKGQFSATAELGSTLVGRSFSGDKKQLSAMLKAAIAHKGTVMLDVVSPCVTFNDHEGSTKSYKYVKEHEETLQDVSFVPHFEDINVEYDPGSTIQVTMHDGSRLHLRKLEEDYDPTDRVRALTRLTEAHDKGEVLTGVFYVNPTAPNFLEMLNVVDQPLATLPDSVTRPPKEVLDACMEELR